jgi:hypothetical protein
MSLVFFHTAQSNADLFSNELAKRDLPQARHVVRADLLKKATKESVGKAQVWSAIEEAMIEAKASGDSLICTCSTLGPVADELARRGEDAGRSDHFLAKAFLSHAHTQNPQGRCAVVIVASSTQAATKDLFERVQQELGASGLTVDIILVEEPWKLFMAGDHQGYLRELAKALDILVPDNQYYEFFALAQASMAEALELCEHEACRTVWTVPGALCDHLLANAR